MFNIALYLNGFLLKWRSKQKKLREGVDATYVHRYYLASRNMALGHELNRSVAQPGSASALGAECRGFESLHSDHFRDVEQFTVELCPWVYLCKALVAQLDRATAF